MVLSGFLFCKPVFLAIFAYFIVWQVWFAIPIVNILYICIVITLHSYMIEIFCNYATPCWVYILSSLGVVWTWLHVFLSRSFHNSPFHAWLRLLLADVFVCLYFCVSFYSLLFPLLVLTRLLPLALCFLSFALLSYFCYLSMVCVPACLIYLLLGHKPHCFLLSGFCSCHVVGCSAMLSFVDMYFANLIYIIFADLKVSSVILCSIHLSIFWWEHYCLM